jgi:hypothetical protein
MLFNQPMDDIILKLGEYTLARNMKIILQKSQKLRLLDKPNTDDDVKKCFVQMSEITGLSNPLESLESLRSLLAKNCEIIMHHYNFDGSWILEILFCMIVDWWYKRPSRILSWNQKDLTDSVPIVNVLAENIETPGILYSGDKKNKVQFDELFGGHFLAYSERIYLLGNLFYLSKIKCPLYFNSKPQLSKSCEHCDGYITNSGLNESCPVFIRNSNILLKK